MAYGLMLVGALCLLVSVTTVIRARAEHKRLQVRQHVEPVDAEQAKTEGQRLAWYWLLSAGGIVVVFLVVTLAMTRFRRRLMAVITSKGTRQTPTEDVWQMHRPPETSPDELYRDDFDAPRDE